MCFKHSPLNPGDLVIHAGDQEIRSVFARLGDDLREFT